MVLLKDTKSLRWSSFFRYLLLKFVLWRTKNSRKSRFAGVHDFRSNDPFKAGAISSSKEIEEEWPYSNTKMLTEKTNDIVTIFCTSKSGQILTVNMTRSPNKTASVFVYLKTLKANYTLSKEFFVDLSADDTFSVDGLKLECVLPLKRWRISFNGLMTNGNTGKEDHVRFVFTANFVNNLADLGSFHSDNLLALQLCNNCQTPLWNLLTQPSLIHEHLNEIDAVIQTYSFVGKVRTTENIEGAKNYEEEVFAFGHKNRRHEKNVSTVHSLGSLMGYTENGISIFLEEFELPEFTPCMTFGVIHYPSFYHARIEVVQTNVMKQDNVSDNFQLAGKNVPQASMVICEELFETKIVHEFNLEYRERKVRVFKITYDDKDGYAVFLGGSGNGVRPSNIPEVPEHLLSLKGNQTAATILSFDDELCSDGSLTGGKASSLAVLTRLSEKCQQFAVAKGLAVTTKAYEDFQLLSAVSEAIIAVEEAFKGNRTSDEQQRVCEKSVELIGNQEIPKNVKNDLHASLHKMFPQLNETKFAVRSSACGEDSEEMSAAGQMETLLGVQGFSNICDAVAKCWASQFSFVAVQYRRRYGQPIKCPMAVCVQEMVNSEVSGVMFTVDPVTSNPKYITITANYGLGESVVSAAADPDTFVIDKSGGKVISSNIGSKKLRTVMLEEGGTKDVIESETKDEANNKACLNEIQLNQLTKAALEVEKYYASQRDTEWAFAPGGKQLYMLQARPVTSAHVLDTAFEYLHERDSSIVSDYDCVSKANVGEVFGGSVPPLSLEIMNAFPRSIKAEETKLRPGPDWEKAFERRLFLFIQNGQCFFGTHTDAIDFSKRDMFSKGFMISLSGRIVDDEIMKIGAANRKRYVNRAPALSVGFLFRNLWYAQSRLDLAEEFVAKTNYSLDDCKTSKEKFLKVLESTEMYDLALDGHRKQIFYGTMNNVGALSLLSSSEGDITTKVFSDFAKVVASCNNLVSAQVPLSLEKISIQALKDYGMSFKELSEEEALTKLKSDETETAKLFDKFLQEHGHRCLNELDLASRPWVLDPLPVVKTIQSMIGVTEIAPRPEMTIPELMESMEIKLQGMKLRALKYFLGNVRKGIANRERGKSCLILAVHKYRMLFLEIASQMVEESYLPEGDLIFFLSLFEIWQLLTTRNPKIVIRAMNRKRMAAVAAQDVYPEMNAGLPLKPINRDDGTIEAKGSRQLSGTPVSQGTVVATARVVLKLEDANQIQKGDILITYATDIGWSPYFPLLGGIVTELGGLISHGAVVAREFGLPCIVGAQGATRLFKSGEKLSLNGTEGILRTID